MHSVNPSSQPARPSLESLERSVEAIREGRRLYKVDQQGNIQEMGILDRIWGILDRIWKHPDASFHQQQREAVKTRVREVVADLQTLSQSKDHELGNNRDERIKDVLFNKLSHLSEKVFSRAEVRGELEAMLKKDLVQNEEHRKVNSQASKDFEELFKEAKLAEKLGVKGEKTSEGVTGAVFIRNLEGKKIGVFKAKQEPNSIGAYLTQFFRQKIAIPAGLARTFNFLLDGRDIRNEVAAKAVDTYLNLNVVPETGFVRLKGGSSEEKEGSLQKFVSVKDNQSLSSASQALEIHDYANKQKGVDEKKVIDKIEFSISDFNLNLVENPKLLREFQKIVILDYVTGNIDRHYGNWLATKDKIDESPNFGQFETTYTSLHAIDNGLSFPHDHNTSDKDMQYLWKHLPIANQPFIEDLEALIQNIDEDGLISHLDQLGLLEPIDSSYGVSQREAIKDRIRVLKRIAAAQKPLKDLAQISTKSSFDDEKLKFDGLVKAALIYISEISELDLSLSENKEEIEEIQKEITILKSDARVDRSKDIKELTKKISKLNEKIRKIEYNKLGAQKRLEELQEKALEQQFDLLSINKLKKAGIENYLRKKIQSNLP